MQNAKAVELQQLETFQQNMKGMPYRRPCAML